MEKKFTITENDIIDIDSYIKHRNSIKTRINKVKKNRRVHVGPHATFYFESYDTMLYQIQEMLFIERGGKEQMKDELKAYNPLIPNGKSLVTTLMFEIDNPNVRQNFLTSIGGIETNTYIKVNDIKIFARAEGDTERTNKDGKASSVHFLHFDFNDSQKKDFLTPGCEIQLGFNHKNYQHISILSENVIESLGNDFF
jgi:hypothetical protein